jgi:hypothetical protein
VHVPHVPEIDKSVGTKNISNIAAVAKFNISSVQLREVTQISSPLPK